MKVGYVAPASISIVNGGIRTQANMTIDYIKAFGVDSIRLSPWDKNVDWSGLDLIHVFGATAENSGIIPRLSDLAAPIVLSPIFFSRRSAKIIRLSVSFENLISFMGNGIRSDFSLKSELCNLADRLLPNTNKEAQLIEMGFKVPSSKIKVVPNGVEKRFSEANKSLFVEKYGLDEFILFAGQANARRKNVIHLIKAACELNIPVVIIGTFGEDTYSRKCLELAHKAENIVLIDSLDHDSEMLSSAYAAAKVFILPSYYETPGIAALEAGLANTNIAITKYGGTMEYFGNHAFYLDPYSEHSIRDSINQALDAIIDPALKTHILNNYTWEKVAEQTYEQYKEVLQ